MNNKFQQNRSIRIFVSSTFKDMIEDRNELMTHTWPELRRFCHERQVELVEIDLRWGIAEEQSIRKETLKFCLDEIRACHPFFIGLLGERYGWVPGDDAFTADLKEEQPWLKELHGKSVTELEILHGVLNNPEMAGRAFFYFRSPAYAKEGGIDFLPENEEAANKQTELKNLIRQTCDKKKIPLHEDYPDPAALAALVLEQLKTVIEEQFPKESIPDPLDKEARDHDAYAEIRRRTYIGRSDYFDALDRHVTTEGAPLVLLGDSGSGKTSLLANWIEYWHKDHPKDYIFQHYIGGTHDSAVHWKIMIRLMVEIKRWTEDKDELPKTNDDILRDFSLWLAKARIKAQRDGIRFIVVLDALNQLNALEHGRLLGWLPENSFSGALRLVVSTLPGDTLEIIEKRNWTTLYIQLLTNNERRRLIIEYLRIFAKKLDETRLNRLVDSENTANPLYLKILLDELRVTGTHERLDERLDDFLAAKDIPSLLSKVLARYQLDYEHDRNDLVSEALGLIWAARRGLTEAELLQLLRPDHLPQLPLATWAPLRAALEEGLVDRGGIINFSHDFLRTAVETAFLPDIDTKKCFREILADYFEAQPPTARSCDELPWLLWKAGLSERLRKCLLDIDIFLEISGRDENELRSYWINLKEERSMGKPYVNSFNDWLAQKWMSDKRKSYAVNSLAVFLHNASLYTEAEPLLRLSLKILEEHFEKDHPNIAVGLNNLARLLRDTNRLREAESYYRRALKIDEDSFGKNHPNVARDLRDLAEMLQDTSRIDEAESFYRRALIIDEKSYGMEHPNVAKNLNNLSAVLRATNRLGEAEPLMRRALQIDETLLGKDHPEIAINLNNLAVLLLETRRLGEAETLLKRALQIDEKSFGQNHTNVAVRLNNLADLLQRTNRMSEAEPLMRRVITIFEINFGVNHPNVATGLNNLALLLKDTDRLTEAEPLIRRALKIDEDSFGKDHPKIATRLNNLSYLLQDTHRLSEAEPISRRVVEILANLSRSTGHPHQHLREAIVGYAVLLETLGWSKGKIISELQNIAPEFI